MIYGLHILMWSINFYELWAANVDGPYELWVANINGSANFYELWAANINGPTKFMNHGLPKLLRMMGCKY